MKIKRKPGATHSLKDVNDGTVIDLLDGSLGLVLRTEIGTLPNGKIIAGVFIDTGEFFTVSSYADLNREVKIVSGSFVEE